VRIFMLTVVSLLLAGATVASDLDEQQPIVIDAVGGDVQLSMQGQTRPATSGTTLQLPASITTGGDGSIELREGRTLIALAADTQIDIPVPSQPDEGLDRIIESRGNVFYSVAKRQISRLHVETPYLVAVVKGTQFNVAAQTDRTTIALFEGQLEVRTPGDTDIVELNSGEIAVHYGTESSIRVLRMDNGQTLRSAVDSVKPGGALLGSTGAAGVSVQQSGSSSTSATSGTDTGIATTGPLEPLGSGTIGANGAVVSGVAAGTGGAGASVGVAAGTIGTAGAGVSASAGIGSSGLSTSAGVSAGLGGGAVNTSVGVGASLGSTGISVSTGVSAAVGGTGLGTSAAVSTNLGSSGLSAATSVSAGLGSSTSVSVGGSVNVTGSGGLSVTSGAGLSVGGTSASVGISTGSTSPTTVGVSLGSTSVTLGTPASSPSVSPTTGTTPTSAPAVSGGLLGGVTSTLGGIVNGVLGGSKPGHP
jgi:hypothetical protein